MKFLTFKSKKDATPSLESLRPPLFDVDSAWVNCILVFFLVILIGAFVGFRFFYYEYNEDYKEESGEENFDNLINVDRLKNSIEKRNSLINQPTPAIRDPSV